MTTVCRIDTDALKRDHPVEEVVSRYGIELQRSGSGLVGRCPFHDDGGRPNLYLYPATQSWYCYRCSIGGDVISFVERMEGVGFREAVNRLTEEVPSSSRLLHHSRRAAPTRRSRTRALGPDERACLAAAVDLYHNRLITDPAALAYVRERGLDQHTIEERRLGYVAGDELAAFLRMRRLPAGAAMRIGLLRQASHELLAGRVVVPEIRLGQPIWLIGRTLDPHVDVPKYLGLPGHKPLLGWDGVRGSPEVILVEGVFDWLILVSWGYPALALVGTYARPGVLRALAGCERVIVLLDSDEAGQVASKSLVCALGQQATTVTLPGVKDVAELATLPNGRHIFARAIEDRELAPAA